MEQATNNLPDAATLKALSERGERIYADTIRAQVEPMRNGECIAIHLDTGAWEIARTDALASEKLRARVGKGLQMSRRIGPPVMDSLTERILASRAWQGLDGAAGGPK